MLFRSWSAGCVTASNTVKCEPVHRTAVATNLCTKPRWLYLSLIHICKHLAFEELTPTLLREMVEKIVVHECSYDENGTLSLIHI